ncbi:cupin domain-containing protein [Rheinheimera sediminis]|uniref:cupin domain-containing protein n=1 Tax=Rheinheimera sp. YQF-1 TaxID=2499626 RepID=UPI000FDC838D|nr:cupin domain-containing protein [Rheinheimera sp. YQF-1]RVT45465.1 cupin domain-containing protein [Rheinheimera sp. YQF-1]
MPNRTTLNIAEAFVVLNQQKQASIEQLDAELYQRLNTNYAGFQGCELISCVEFEQDWLSWEIHPQGDETVILLSGQVTLVVQQASGEQELLLAEAGDFVVIPSNTWHCARTKVKTKLLFITPGEGTQHKPL